MLVPRCMDVESAFVVLLFPSVMRGCLTLSLGRSVAVLQPASFQDKVGMKLWLECHLSGLDRLGGCGAHENGRLNLHAD